MDMKQVITLCVLMLATVVNVSLGGHLKPGFGVSFTHVGYVQPALDSKTLILDIKLPAYRQPRYKNLTLECPNDEFLTTALDICEDFRSLLKKHITSNRHNDEQINREIIRIIELIPDDNTAELPLDSDIRTKRAIPLLVPIAIGIASGVANIVNTIDMRRKISTLKRAVTILEENQYNLHEGVMEMQDHMGTIIQVSNENFDKIGSGIIQTNRRISKLATNMKNNLAQILTKISESEYVMEKTFRSLTNYMTASLQFMSRTSKHYNNMHLYLESYKTGLIELMQGKLPATLIPPHVLRDILTRSAKALYMANPNYELVFTSVAHYYRKTDVLYTSKDGHLLVSMPLLLKKTNQKPMELFRIEQCYVPYTVENKTNMASTSYTKVQLNTDFIAVGGHNFAEISHAQLEACTDYNDFYLCHRHLLQVHESSLTCSSALFWDATPKDINAHCTFLYMHSVKPAPCILEADEFVLLTNMGEHWSFRCSDNNMPQRLVGSNFAVIHKNNFCSCALVGKDYFIPQRMEDCESRPDKIELLFPVNSGVLSVFSEDIDDEHLLEDLSKLYNKPIKLNIPKLNITLSEVDPDVLIDNDLSQGIDLKRIAAAVRSKHRVYLDRQEKNKQNQNLGNWFSGLETLSMSITFILALIGATAAIVTCYNCVRSHRVMSLFGALVTKAELTQALEFENKACDQVHYMDIIKDRLFQMIVVLTLYVGYRLLRHVYKKWSLVKLLLPNTVSVHKGAISHLHIELGHPLKGVCKVYLCSLHTTVLNLQLIGTMEVVRLCLKLSRFKTFGILRIDWPETTFQIFHDRVQVILPGLAYLSIWQYFRLSRIIKNDHLTRVVLTYDGLLYVLAPMQRHHSNPVDTLAGESFASGGVTPPEGGHLEPVSVSTRDDAYSHATAPVLTYTPEMPRQAPETSSIYPAITRLAS